METTASGLSHVVLVAAGCLGAAILLVIYALGARPDAVRHRAVANLQRGLLATDAKTAGDEASGGSLARVSRRLTPKGWLSTLDSWHARAGRPAAWPMDRVLVAKIVLGGLGLVVALLLWLNAPEPRSLLIGIFAVALFWFLPDLLLLNRGIKRRDAIGLKLPDTLDQLTIAVEAGLGFEAALNHVARNSEGPLAEELIRTLQDMQVGVPRRDAYRDLGDRTQVRDLRRFTRAIIQAEQHGVSIARVLEIQASEMRLKRRQRAEETAMKIPVKVIFPLMFCILPALFVVILGPAVLTIMETFSG